MSIFSDFVTNTQLFLHSLNRMLCIRIHFQIFQSHEEGEGGGVGNVNILVFSLKDFFNPPIEESIWMTVGHAGYIYLFLWFSASRIHLHLTCIVICLSLSKTSLSRFLKLMYLHWVKATIRMQILKIQKMNKLYKIN